MNGYDDSPNFKCNSIIQEGKKVEIDPNPSTNHSSVEWEEEVPEWLEEEKECQFINIDEYLENSTEMPQDAFKQESGINPSNELKVAINANKQQIQPSANSSLNPLTQAQPVTSINPSNQKVIIKSNGQIIQVPDITYLNGHIPSNDKAKKSIYLNGYYYFQKKTGQFRDKEHMADQFERWFERLKERGFTNPSSKPVDNWEFFIKNSVKKSISFNSGSSSTKSNSSFQSIQKEKHNHSNQDCIHLVNLVMDSIKTNTSKEKFLIKAGYSTRQPECLPIAIGTFIQSAIQEIGFDSTFTLIDSKISNQVEICPDVIKECVQKQLDAKFLREGVGSKYV
jgi:hypothetical protein